MNGTPLQLTLREMRGHFADPRTLGIIAVVSIVLGFAGPFGTFEELGVLPRIVYWAAIVALTYATGFGLSMLADLVWNAAGGRPFWQRLSAMVVPTSLGTTLVVTLINIVAFGTAQLSAEAVLLLFGQCLAVTGAVIAIMLMLERSPTTGVPNTDLPPPVLGRVPLPQRGRLLALSVEDHYVDIVTDRGKTLVLMRLADAMRETGSLAGLQIHRSHWVARDAVVKAHRSDGKLMLELSNGMRLPVSRGYAAAVKAAGLA